MAGEREFLSPSRLLGHHSRSRNLLFLPSLAALGILVFTFSSGKLSLGKWMGKDGQRVDSTSLERATNVEPDAKPVFHYIDPHNGDNGTDPAQTTTDECAGDFTLPVLAGVDVVAYFSLPQGAAPVFGSENRVAFFGNYRFYFSSIENLRLFEYHPVIPLHTARREHAGRRYRQWLNHEPLKYIPAWGGFCSYGISNESVWTETTLGPFSDPTKWDILPDGRLHVFRSSIPQAKFLTHIPELLGSGQDVWTGWFGEDEVGPLNTACFCSEAICDDK